MQADYLPIEEATATYASRCAEKLRKENSCAGMIMIFLHTNQFRSDLPQYAKNIVIKLPVATNSSLELVHYAKEGLRRIYKSGFYYKKSGVIVSDIVGQNQVQQNFFDGRGRKKHRAIMNAMDSINVRQGKDAVRIASLGFSQDWKLKQQMMSKRASTRLSEIITVNI